MFQVLAAECEGCIGTYVRSNRCPCQVCHGSAGDETRPESAEPAASASCGEPPAETAEGEEEEERAQDAVVEDVE